MSGKRSQKWKTFENNAAKEISSWLFGDPKILRRSPCSGGWLRRGSEGDIIVAEDQDKYGPDYFCAVEAKCRLTRSGSKKKDGSKDEWHFEQLLTSPKHPILEWWYQLCSSEPVVRDKKLRLLAFSKTSGTTKAFLAIGRREYDFIETSGVSLRALPKMVFEVGRCEDPSIDTEVLHFFCFREFLGYVDADKVKKLWRNQDATG